MSDKPDLADVRIRKTEAIRKIALYACAIIGTALIIDWLGSAMTYDASQFPGDPCNINNPQFASAPTNEMYSQGWGQPRYSPNRKYMLKIWSTDYGETTFAVLTADCKREIYWVDNRTFGMIPTGCYPEGWQPDGTFLFCSIDPSGIHRLNPDTGEIDLVCRDGTPVFSSHTIRWSPDGERIAMIVGSPFTPATMYVVDNDGSNLMPVTEIGWNDSLDWSPDGKRIVYMINKERIGVVDTDGTHQRELATGINPRWSPDGKAIAFVRKDSMYRRSLYRISPDGSNLALIIQTSMKEFAWSPDGDRIAITRATSESVHADEIVIIPAQASTDEHIVISDQLFVYHLAWSPDGKKIAFEGRASLSVHVGLYVIDNDGIRLKRIADDTEGMPSWGPDSKRLLFIRERPDGNMGISFRNLNYGTVWDVDYETSREVAFSPDGETIALTHLTDIYLGNIDGRPLVNLTGPLASQFEHPCKP